MVQKRKLSKSQYNLNSKRIFKSGRSREYFVPYSVDSEKILCAVFARSGKPLRDRFMVKKYICGKSWIGIYRFKQSYVYMECVTRRFMRVKFSWDVSRWMRAAVVRCLMIKNETLWRLAWNLRREDIYELSLIWKKFIESGDKRKFGNWVKKSDDMKRIVEYRSKHHVI